MFRVTFAYGPHPGQTVTVVAPSSDAAVPLARELLDRRYSKLGKEPPVAWTLRFKSKRPVTVKK